MSDISNFHKKSQELFPVLIQYVPVVDRVHGEHHPEFHEVRRLFEVIHQKTNSSLNELPDLHLEFSQLKEITQDYAIPNDVCETYEAVYGMLNQLESAFIK
ncbi:MAG: iron-sulfur cluster repair di-iron protein, ric [Firmicutes bacterium HGW-Firmicutes-10]|jgi:regulator of cell morphogenesis and NO signaling|nr:MAG: iron-sulfur cluster repair di-iron protein, ric [Firmicutes bacterium HGW-Firmicutes-10]